MAALMNMLCGACIVVLTMKMQIPASLGLENARSGQGRL
jgi:hypothetical protein